MFVSRYSYAAHAVVRANTAPPPNTLPWHNYANAHRERVIASARWLVEAARQERPPPPQDRPRVLVVQRPGISPPPPRIRPAQER
jgi:hypothetical protein